jgi:hypothetical protein
LDGGRKNLGLNKNFKQCSKCGYAWDTRHKFLEDPKLHIIGYQVNFDELEQGFFLFNHTCGTTLAIMAGDFRDLYDGPIYSERLTEGKECLRYCLVKDELRPCPAKCECAYAREIIQTIKGWPKNLGIQ